MSAARIRKAQPPVVTIHKHPDRFFVELDANESGYFVGTRANADKIARSMGGGRPIVTCPGCPGCTPPACPDCGDTTGECRSDCP